MYRFTLDQICVLLRERRGKRGLRAVAEEIGVSASTLSRVENGRQPDLESLRAICKWLDVDPLGFEEGLEGSVDEQSFSVHFRADRELSKETAKHLGQLIFAVHQALERERVLAKNKDV